MLVHLYKLNALFTFATINTDQDYKLLAVKTV